MGVRVREKRAGSSEFWVFVASKGQRASRLVGDREAAETAATVIQAKLTLGDRSIFDPPASIAPTPEPGEITLREYAARVAEEPTRASPASEDNPGCLRGPISTCTSFRRSVIDRSRASPGAIART